MVDYANKKYPGEIYITRFSAWAPGIEIPCEWDKWALGERNILPEAKAPEIAYTDPTFRRRLSQVSKMSIQVIHDLLPLKEDTKILFSSFRGELSREFQIFRMLKEEGALRPAAFSLSGFNTPVALACIAFGLKGGYSAIYPAKDSFSACLKAAQAVLCGTTGDLVLVYADENIPPECSCFFRPSPSPAAFALLLSGNSQSSSVSLSSLNTEEDNPLAFLRQVILRARGCC